MIPQHHYVSCVGCGTRVHAYDSTRFTCPNRDLLPDQNHVLQKKQVITKGLWMQAAIETHENPFVKYRHRLLGYHRLLNAGRHDEDYIARVERLSDRLDAVDGRHFVQTPLVVADKLAKSLGMHPSQRLFVKDETHNVAGSHKARHLFGVMLNLDQELMKRRFAIASCGNAALAAAVLCRAADVPLDVYIPTDAEEAVVDALQKLSATLHVVEREPGVAGDPCYHAFRAAVKNGALPFTCQGTDNGLTIEGGQTLAYELFDQIRAQDEIFHHLVIQVGGAALASASAQALVDVMRHEPLANLPRLHVVQTRGAFPLIRAYDRVVAMIRARLDDAPLPDFRAKIDDMSHADRAQQHSVENLPTLLEQADLIRSVWDSTETQSIVRYAANQRDVFMWAWEEAPHSVAHGILDDETYDWFEVVRAMLRTGGIPLVASEDRLKNVNALAHQSGEFSPSFTGSAGAAGLSMLVDADAIREDERAVIYMTGIKR